MDEAKAQNAPKKQSILNQAYDSIATQDELIEQLYHVLRAVRDSSPESDKENRGDTPPHITDLNYRIIDNNAKLNKLIKEIIL